jgi:hypothetical protein
MLKIGRNSTHAVFNLDVPEFDKMTPVSCLSAFFVSRFKRHQLFLEVIQFLVEPLH